MEMKRRKRRNDPPPHHRILLVGTYWHFPDWGRSQEFSIGKRNVVGGTRLSLAHESTTDGAHLSTFTAPSLVRTAHAIYRRRRELTRD